MGDLAERWYFLNLQIRSRYRVEWTASHRGSVLSSRKHYSGTEEPAEAYSFTLGSSDKVGLTGLLRRVSRIDASHAHRVSHPWA